MGEGDISVGEIVWNRRTTVPPLQKYFIHGEPFNAHGLNLCIFPAP